MMHPTSGRLNYEDLASQCRRVTLRSLDGNTLEVVDVTAATSYFELKQRAASALAYAVEAKEVDDMSEVEAKQLLKEMRKRQREGLGQ